MQIGNDVVFWTRKNAYCFQRHLGERRIKSEAWFINGVKFINSIRWRFLFASPTKNPIRWQPSSFLFSSSTPLTASPNMAVESLRSSQGTTVMSFCTSPNAPRTQRASGVQVGTLMTLASVNPRHGDCPNRFSLAPSSAEIRSIQFFSFCIPISAKLIEGVVLVVFHCFL